MKFQVLTDNATDCDLLADYVREALIRLELEFPVLTETSPGRVAALGVPPPVLMEDNLIISSGRLLSAEEVAALIRSRYAGEEMEKLKRLSDRAKKRTAMTRRLLLLGAVACAVFMVFSELRTRRELSAQEAGTPIRLHFSSPLKIYYFYREPYSKTDQEQVIRLRHAAFKAFHEEAMRNLVLIQPLDAGKPETAKTAHDCGVDTTPAVVLQKNGVCRKFDMSKQEKPLAFRIYQTVNEMK